MHFFAVFHFLKKLVQSIIHRRTGIFLLLQVSTGYRPWCLYDNGCYLIGSLVNVIVIFVDKDAHRLIEFYPAMLLCFESVR